MGVARHLPSKAHARGRKGGQRVGIVRESPPNAHAKGMKGGQRVGIVRESPPNAQAMGVKGGQRVGTQKTGPITFRASIFIKYSAYRFLLSAPGIQEPVRLISGH